jgi:hypothetical protein
MNAIHTPTNCQALNCGRIHIGDTVRVVHGNIGTVGFMQCGEVVANPYDSDRYTVHFPDGGNYQDAKLGHIVTVDYDPTYYESELENLTEPAATVTLRTRQANNVMPGDFLANLGLVNAVTGAGVLRIHGPNGSYIEAAWDERVVLAS